MLVGLTLESTPEAEMGFTSLELHGPSEVAKGCGWETTCVCFTYIVLNIVTSARRFKICVTHILKKKNPKTSYTIFVEESSECSRNA